MEVVAVHLVLVTCADTYRTMDLTSVEARMHVAASSTAVTIGATVAGLQEAAARNVEETDTVTVPGSRTVSVDVTATATVPE